MCHLIIAPKANKVDCLIEMTKHAHKPTTVSVSSINYHLGHCVCAQEDNCLFLKKKYTPARTQPDGTQIRPPVTQQPSPVASANVCHSQIATCHRPINLAGQFSFQLIKL